MCLLLLLIVAMGEPVGLVADVEQLAKFLADSNSGAIVSRQEVAQKIELSPMDMKLEGAANYLSWSRMGIVGCGAEGT